MSNYDLNNNIAMIDNYNHSYETVKKYNQICAEQFDKNIIYQNIINLSRFPLLPLNPYRNQQKSSHNYILQIDRSCDDICCALINDSKMSVDSAIVSLLSVMLMTSRGKVYTEVTPDWIEQCSLYVLNISSSGSNKSGMTKKFICPLEDYEQKHRQEISSEFLQIAKKEHTNIVKKALRQIFKNSNKLEQDFKMVYQKHQKICDEIFSSCKLLASNITPLALLQLLQEQGESISFLDSEPHIFYNLKKDNKLLELFLSGYTGEPVRYQSSYKIYDFNRLCINMCIMCQPREANKIISNKEFADRGLLGRIIPIYNSQAYLNNYGYNWQDVANNYNQRIYNLLDYFSNCPDRVKFTLSNDAKNHLLNLRPHISESITPVELTPQLNSFYGKFRGLIVRLATAIHLYNFERDNYNFVISLEEIQIAELIFSNNIDKHIRFLYGKYTPQVYKIAYKILQYFQSISSEQLHLLSNGVFVSEIKKNLHLKGVELDAPLELLTYHNFIRILKFPNKKDIILLNQRFYHEFHLIASDFLILD